MTEGIYLDNAATTVVAPEVLEAMRPFFAENFGNASSIHAFGQRARAALETARAQVARLINAKPGDLAFTSGGTEADNTALFGVIEAAGTRSSAPHLIISAVEHHAVLNSAQVLQKRGARVTYVPVERSGMVDPQDVERAICPETVLISIMHANNELGTIQPIEEIGRLARARGVLMHTDAVQSVGKVPVDVEKLNVDLLSLSAHKFHGPKGTGALYVRKGTKLSPLLYGGHHERDRRAGTENVPGAVGAGQAAELAQAKLASDMPRVAALRDRLEENILGTIAFSARNGDPARRLPTTTNIRFEHIDGEALVIALDLQGVACSTGAACSSGSLEPSHVLSAIGLSKAEARSSMRFSLGRFTTAEEVGQALEILPAVVEHLRSISPTYKRQAASA